MSVMAVRGTDGCHRREIGVRTVKEGIDKIIKILDELDEDVVIDWTEIIIEFKRDEE